MERIKSIMTEEIAATKSLSKLKIDITKTDDKNILKAISFIQRNLKDEELDTNLLLESVESVLNEVIHVDILEVDKTDRINNAWKNTNFKYEARKVDNQEINKLYFDMNGKLPLGKNGSRYSWRNGGDKFKVLNGKRLIAIHILWNKISEDIHDPELQEYFVKNYFYKTFNFMLDKKYDELILNMIMEKLQEELNIELMTKYENETKKEIATAMKTKKNIKDNVMAAMEESNFLKHGFSYVEYDNDTDLEKVDQLEIEWNAQKEKLVSISAMPSLRFRKLGKHKAWGLYSPSHNTIAIDIRNVNSFIHEYGHLVDYQLQDDTLSMKKEFSTIIMNYRKAISDQLDNDSYVVKKMNYYVTPTEVFARAFEIYMSNKLNESSFLKTHDDYKEKDEYKVFTEENIELINEFMIKYVG